MTWHTGAGLSLKRGLTTFRHLNSSNIVIQLRISFAGFSAVLISVTQSVVTSENRTRTYEVDWTWLKPVTQALSGSDIRLQSISVESVQLLMPVMWFIQIYSVTDKDWQNKAYWFSQAGSKLVVIYKQTHEKWHGLSYFRMFCTLQSVYIIDLYTYGY